VDDIDNEAFKNGRDGVSKETELFEKLAKMMKNKVRIDIERIPQVITLMETQNAPEGVSPEMIRYCGAHITKMLLCRPIRFNEEFRFFLS
jgi:hypothetical protein